MYNSPQLEILEVNYAVSPGGVDEFEVYSLDEHDLFDPPIFVSESLSEAVAYCYALGKDFVVKTLAQWEEREMANEYV